MSAGERPDEALRWSNIGRLLLTAFDAFERRTIAGIRAAGFTDFTMAHGKALRNVQADGTRLSELARRARMTKQGMGQLVDDLEARGYVERGPDPDDGRAKRVLLTERGRALIAVGQRVYTELERDWGARLGEGGLRRLRDALRDVAAFEASRNPDLGEP